MIDTVCKRYVVSAPFVLALCFVAIVCRGDAAEEKPNIIFFIGDDHSWWDSGCYGNDVVKTPNIDRLASQGMRFDRAYTVSAMCAVARSALYTGLYPHRNGCHMNHGLTREGTQSLPHYLKPLGYRVVLAEKTHIKPKSVYPFEYVKMQDAPSIIDSEEPFCLIVASHEPHGPHKNGEYDHDKVLMPPFLPDMPEFRKKQAGYYADIDALDKEIGVILDRLEQSGKSDNTLFVYAGDHGIGIMSKWTCYEAGLRVPFIARWPGRIEAGTTTDAMVSFVDVLPTFLEAAGAEVHADLDGRSFLKLLEGESRKHRDLVFGAHTNRGIISGDPYPIRSVRGQRYKYIRNLNPEGQPTNISTHGFDFTETSDGLWGSWKEKAEKDPEAARLLARVMTRPAEELYDLDSDPWELKNLADDPALAEVKTRLSSELDQWMLKQGDRGLEGELEIERFYFTPRRLRKQN